MLRYKTETRPGLVALYDIRPGNGAGPCPHGAWHGKNEAWVWCRRYSTGDMNLLDKYQQNLVSQCQEVIRQPRKAHRCMHRADHSATHAPNHCIRPDSMFQTDLNKSDRRVTNVPLWSEVHLKIFPWLNFLPSKSPSHDRYSSTRFLVSSASGSSFVHAYDS